MRSALIPRASAAWAAAVLLTVPPAAPAAARTQTFVNTSRAVVEGRPGQRLSLTAFLRKKPGRHTRPHHCMVYLFMKVGDWWVQLQQQATRDKERNAGVARFGYFVPLSTRLILRALDVGPGLLRQHADFVFLGRDTMVCDADASHSPAGPGFPLREAPHGSGASMAVAARNATATGIALRSPPQATFKANPSQ